MTAEPDLVKTGIAGLDAMSVTLGLSATWLIRTAAAPRVSAGSDVSVEPCSHTTASPKAGSLTVGYKRNVLPYAGDHSDCFQGRRR